MKVYELAKKLEVKSVFLMDKIRKEWKLPVKTHMETLTPELVKKIEEKFYDSQKTIVKKSSKKKKSITKKSTVKKITAKKSAVKKQTDKKITKKTSTEKKKTSPVKKTVTKKQKTSVNKTTESPFPAEEQAEKKETRPQVKRKIIIRRSTEAKKASEATVVSPKEQSPTPEKEDRPSPVTRPATSKSIRLDLVSVKTTDPLDESFWGKQEEEKNTKKQPKKPISEKDVSSKFNATDFRKREVIFQPRKKRTAQAGEFKNTQITTPKSHKRIIKVHGKMTVENLCKKMGLKKQTLIKNLKNEGIDTKELTDLDFDTIALIVPSFGFEAKNTKQTEKEILDKLENKTVIEEKTKFVPKPPVVTIMGHVDHGKTTLLDSIRKAKVAEEEAGGITQHIGAYSIFFEKNPITFIDTPGHEAFTAMRSRGAQVTDIVVILVSAPDGVMPQTIEALNHAKASKTPIIIAISKMDAPGANPDKIKQQMSEQGIVPEDWGGDISFIPISAVKEEGIKELLEQIQLVAEMQELKCQPEGPAKGVVLEARREKGLGSIVSLLVRDGTLKPGQNIVAGECMGRIRQMKNDQRKIIKEVKPGFSVEAMGFHDLPQAGDIFYTVTNEKTARDLLALRKDQNQSPEEKQTLSPEEMLLKMELSSDKKRELNIILKADVQGSLEALKASLEKIKSDEVSLKIIHSGAGAISESDILLASAISGTVLGFNVRPDGKAVKIAKEKSVDIYTYSIIYELLDQVKKLMLGLLKVESMEEEQGQAEVRDIFHISKIGAVAGCYVTNGKISRNSFIRLVRDGRLIHDGSIASLRRFKEDVKQVGVGFECGISLENFNDIKPKDILEAYIKKEKARTEL